MPGRPQHPDARAEQFLQWLESIGWSVSLGDAHFIGRCGGTCGHRELVQNVAEIRPMIEIRRRSVEKYSCTTEEEDR